MSALNPVYTIGNQIKSTFEHRDISKEEAEFLEKLIHNAARTYEWLSHQFSGGQRPKNCYCDLWYVIQTFLCRMSQRLR